MSRFEFVVLCGGACLAGLQSLTLTGQEASTVNTEAPKFLRYVEKSGQPKALEVAVVHFEFDQRGRADVDLVGSRAYRRSSYYHR